MPTACILSAATPSLVTCCIRVDLDNAVPARGPLRFLCWDPTGAADGSSKGDPRQRDSVEELVQRGQPNSSEASRGSTAANTPDPFGRRRTKFRLQSV